VNSLSFKTRFGWISAFEEKGKIVSIKFGKYRNKKYYKKPSIKNYKSRIKI